MASHEEILLADDGPRMRRLVRTTPGADFALKEIGDGQEALEAADKEKGKQAGADDYFVKPFSPTALLNKVCEILD